MNDGGRRVGLNLAVEVDVAALEDGGGRDGPAQLQLDPRRVSTFRLVRLSKSELLPGGGGYRVWGG